MRFVLSAGIRQRYRADFRGPHRVQFDRRWHLRNSVQPVGLDPTTHDDLCSYALWFRGLRIWQRHQKKEACQGVRVRIPHLLCRHGGAHRLPRAQALERPRTRNVARP